MSKYNTKREWDLLKTAAECVMNVQGHVKNDEDVRRYDLHKRLATLGSDLKLIEKLLKDIADKPFVESK